MFFLGVRLWKDLCEGAGCRHFPTHSWFWVPFRKGLACAFTWKGKSSRDLSCWSCAVACEELYESSVVSRAPSHKENRGAAALSLAGLPLSPSLSTTRLRASKCMLRGCWKAKQHLHSGSEMESSALVLKVFMQWMWMIQGSNVHRKNWDVTDEVAESGPGISGQNRMCLHCVCRIWISVLLGKVFFMFLYFSE